MDSWAWSKLVEAVDELGCGTIKFVKKDDEDLLLIVDDVSVDDDENIVVTFE